MGGDTVTRLDIHVAKTVYLPTAVRHLTTVSVTNVLPFCTPDGAERLSAPWECAAHGTERRERTSVFRGLRPHCYRPLPNPGRRLRPGRSVTGRLRPRWPSFFARPSRSFWFIGRQSSGIRLPLPCTPAVALRRCLVATAARPGDCCFRKFIDGSRRFERFGSHP